ncbi:MAG: hypothetical protein HIU85_08540 [Proteobacteria bacterium]|nr:hypothetical protein [Pseudomonadota bacterium]
MSDVRRALAQIEAIRGQVARATQFRGYGPATLAATGVLAVMAAAAQAALVSDPREQIASYLSLWVGTAIVSLALISLETISRARRAHPTLSLPMLRSAGEEFLPALVAGSLLTVVIARGSAGDVWMLPGLWQILFSLGVFASCRLLPRPMLAVGLWYLASGLLLLARGSGEYALSPWAMGVPFGVGQSLVAAVLWLGYREAHESS